MKQHHSMYEDREVKAYDVRAGHVLVMHGVAARVKYLYHEYDKIVFVTNVGTKERVPSGALVKVRVYDSPERTPPPS